MQITIKSTRIIKEGTQEKSGKPYKFISVMAEDGSEKGTEYTTFDAGVLKHAPGTVLDIGDPDIKEGKLSFKKVVKVVSEVAAPAVTTLGATPGMTPEAWAEKDRLERRSIEAQTAFKGIVQMVCALFSMPGKEIPEPLFKAYEEGIEWARSRFKAQMPVAEGTVKKSEKKSRESAKVENNEDFAGGANPGEFYTKCHNRYKLTKSQVDKEISMYDLTDAKQREKAWLEISAAYAKEIEPEDLQF